MACAIKHSEEHAISALTFYIILVICRAYIHSKATPPRLHLLHHGKDSFGCREWPLVPMLLFVRHRCRAGKLSEVSLKSVEHAKLKRCLRDISGCACASVSWEDTGPLYVLFRDNNAS